jgi:hypothetical protein
MNVEQKQEVDACRQVAAIAFSGICGNCNPNLCDDITLANQTWMPPPQFIPASYTESNATITDEYLLFYYSCNGRPFVLAFFY